MRRSSSIAFAAACFAAIAALGLGASVAPAQDEPVPLQASCGNNRCEPPEDCNTCPRDCGQCCGNNRCEPPEDCNTCPRDCGRC